MNKRLLFLMASLLLCGAVSAQNYWGDDPNSHAQPSNTPIVASVTMDGTAVTTSNAMRLGAFVGDELRGIAAPHTDGKFWIQVFYTDANDHITFKFYDGTNEYTTCETTLDGSEEGYGTPGAPQVLNFTTTQTMTTELAQGWTWWSTPIEITNGEAALTMIENSLEHNGVTIKSQNDFTINYYGEVDYDLWYGGLEAINNEQGYMIQTNTACNVSMVGVFANPSNHEITLTRNWNWIGYPVSTNQYVTPALSALEPVDGDVLKDKNNFTTYYEGFGWYPDDFVLYPGKGYMYYSNSNTNSFHYTIGRDNVDNTNNDLYWTPITDKYPFNNSIIAVLSIGDKEITDDIEVGAFVNDECRGSVKLSYFPPTGRYYALLCVSGTNKETISFKTLDLESETYISFKENEIVGSLDNPLVIKFTQPAMETNYISLYPNPVKRNQEFKVLIPEEEQVSEYIINDMVGTTIYKETTNKNTLISSVSPGVYLLKVICKSGNIYYSKFIVE